MSNQRVRSLRKGTSERGAALVSTLLISALLLTAGGMLILTTAMTGTGTIDTAAEAQAFYGAEAGLQATLNVLRGRTMPNPLFAANPAGGVAAENKISFAKAVNPATSNRTNDPAGTLPRLSRWLPYSYQPPGSPIADRVGISANYTPINGIAYSVTVSDPDGRATPIRLLIESTGYGPRGARKKLSLMVGAYGLVVDEVPAPVVLRGHDNRTTGMNFDLGSSGAETYSGIDKSVIDPNKPALAFNQHDVATFLDATAKLKSKVLSNPAYKVLNLPNEPAVPAGSGVEPPWFLKTANDARAFVAQAEQRAHELALAGKEAVVLNSLDGTAGSIASPQLTIVKGDCELTSGAGLLVVTGRLIVKGGGINFKGLILVLGSGQVLKSGGGSKDMFGSIMVARFGSTGDFLEPTFDVDGGGSSNLQYDSQSVIKALELTGQRVLGVVEK